MRKHIVRLHSRCPLCFASASHAFAVSKEMVQLQTQVQQLQDMVQHLQTSNDERMGVIVNLVQQNTDNVNRMMASVNALQTTLKMENDQRGTSNTQLSDSDPVAERLRRRAEDAHRQPDHADAIHPEPAAEREWYAGAASGRPGCREEACRQPGSPGPGCGAAGSQTSQAPPVDQLYQSALRDYNSAKYNIAASEFGDVIHYYPQDPLAGNAQFYLGEINYRQGKYAAAVKAYDAVLEQYSGNSKAPAAELRKGQSLIEMGQKDAGVRELRTLVQRYPQTPEAQEGRSKLNGMGVRIYAAKPSAYPPTSP